MSAGIAEHLNKMFRPAAAARKTSGFYPVRKGGEEAIIAKAGKLWTVTLDGRVYRNRFLTDLKDQVAELGWKA